MRKAIAFLIACAVLAMPVLAVPDIGARAAILINADTGKVLYERNADERMLIASTTKIMTALVVLENCGLDELVEIDSRSAGTEGSSMYLRSGETYTVEELLYGLMLASGNDAASALAIHAAGDIESFAELMNEKAEELGMAGTHFTNPHGLDAEGHYSTARDMARLGACRYGERGLCPHRIYKERYGARQRDIQPQQALGHVFRLYRHQNRLHYGGGAHACELRRAGWGQICLRHAR